MKKLLLLLLCTLSLLALCACGTPAPEEPEDSYPEGSIALTSENFLDYFEIKVKTDLSVDYVTDELGTHQLTEAISYVAIVPKDDYRTVSGVLRFRLNSAIGRSPASSYPEMHVSSSELQLTLDDEIVNKSYRLSAQRDVTYYVIKNSDNITLKDVCGYLIPGEKESATPLDLLTDEERASSPLVLEELRERIDAYALTFPTIDSYSYRSRGIQIFKSLYGAGRDVSNAVNYGKNPYLIDRIRRVYTRTVYSYYIKNDVLFEQQRNEYGLVLEDPSPYTEEQILAEATPDFTTLLDTGAIFVKGDTEGVYYAYTTLSKVENPTVKSGLQQPLTNYGCTSRQNEFLVTYTYLFDGDDFTYDVTLTYQNPRYHVEYVDIRVGLGFDLYDVGTTEPPICTPETHSFALEDNYEDAKTYLSGMVSVTPDTERIYYTLFQTSSRYESANEENYLPIHITVSGLYEFLDQDGTPLTLYSMETRREVSDFYEAGIYYIRFTHVLYGATRRVMLVSQIPLRDYADMENPIAQNGNTLSLDLESYRDKQAFAFTPSESGIYVFSDTEAHLGFSLYLKSDTKNEILSICQPYLMFYLEEGKEYIITAYLFRQSLSDRPTFCGDLTLTSVGDPMKEPPLLKEEYQQIFLGNGMQSLLVHIEEAGYYSVDLRYIDGVEEPYGYFADEEGYSDPRAERVTLADGREAYYLSEGDYLFTFSMMNHCYLIAEARLVTETE